MLNSEPPARAQNPRFVLVEIDRVVEIVVAVFQVGIGIDAIDPLNNRDTPGLGARITEVNSDGTGGKCVFSLPNTETA